VEQFGLSEVQADAILQMQLRRLTALEAEKIQAEHEDLCLKITDLLDILARKERIEAIIEEEVTQIKTTHATPRRSRIIQAEGELLDTDLIANEQAIILLTEQGYIKRMPVNTFGTQSRATRGKAGAKIKEDDVVEHFLSCCDHDSVLFFTDKGVVYNISAYEIPASSRAARGMPIVQMLPISQNEKITSMVAVSEFSEDVYLVMLTRQGYIKKTALAAFSNIRANGLIAISLEEDDQLRWVRLAKEGDSVIIGSRQGMAIHFKTDHQQLRPLGRNTRGVKSMKRRNNDEVISMDILPSQIVANIASSDDEDDLETPEIETLEVENEETIMEEISAGPWLLAITTGGLGKRIPVELFRLQRRGGMGVRAIKFRNPNDQLAALHVVNKNDNFMIITSRGIIIRQEVDAISSQSRSAKGVRVQKLDEDDAIAAVALVPPLAEGEEETTETAE
jgi:DNA gyrase subunit A